MPRLTRGKYYGLGNRKNKSSLEGRGGREGRSNIGTLFQEVGKG